MIKQIMYKIVVSIALIFVFNSTLNAQCSCYSVQGLDIVGQDSMLLQLSNNCDFNVYLNLYVISTVSPFDTLGRQELWTAFILPFDSIIDNILATTLTTVPSFGTYRVSISNGTLNCDSLQFSPTLSVYHHDYTTDIRVFPNPSQGNFSIDLGFNFKSVTISILNVMGQTIQSKIVKESQMINLQFEEPAGVYFLIIESENESTVINLIKE